MTSVLWYRRDLRLADHPALASAVRHSPVAPLFVVDMALLGGRWPSANRAAFLVGCLRALDAGLRAHGNRLNVRVGRPEIEVPRFAREVGASAVFVSRDYSPYSRRRDAAVSDALRAEGIQFHGCGGTLIHEPEEVLTAAGAPYSQFGPFFRRWQQRLPRQPVPLPGQIECPPGVDAGALPTLDQLGVSPSGARLLESGEAAAEKRLAAWIAGGARDYHTGRDALAGEHTSRLSQDLKWGTLSPLQVLGATAGQGEGSAKYHAELAWREFYCHVLWHNPRVLREPFLRQFSHVRWDEPGERFAAWKSGRTGYPIVDAGMRQLLATGYMHNRARMIVASFLTKDLHVDWRLGEAHFMEHLVDGDIASNNGGWQWAASTGTDPQPYFRIFNPTLQSQRFDPEGAYIRRWVAELANVPRRFIHEPARMPLVEQRAADCIIGTNYPAPIVDHGLERVRALALYSESRTGSVQMRHEDSAQTQQADEPKHVGEGG